MRSTSLTPTGEILAPSELVLDNRGAVYHLGIRPEELANTILIAGDPGRIKKISSHFDRIEFVHENREFVTHTGLLGGKRITALATGIGTDNIDIVLNELDALVNIDLEKRTVKPALTKLNIIRLGTCGALRADVDVDSLVFTSFAMGLDNVCSFYANEPNSEEAKLHAALKGYLDLPDNHPNFYVAQGNKALLEALKGKHQSGITATASGFYGPQGRQLRLKPNAPDLNEQFARFEHGDLRFMNYEMETSALFGLSAMLGHAASTVCTVIANRYHKAYSADYPKAVGKMIEHVIEKVAPIL